MGVFEVLLAACDDSFLTSSCATLYLLLQTLTVVAAPSRLRDSWDPIVFHIKTHLRSL